MRNRVEEDDACSSVVPLDEAEARLDELIASAEAGDTLVIARDGRPVARLMPPRKTPE